MGGSGDVPILFYSRRIGLTSGPGGADLGRRPDDRPGRPASASGCSTCKRARPKTGSGRSAAAPSTNFSVVRVKRDILRRSSIGAHRHEPLGLAESARIEPDLWRRWRLRVLTATCSSTPTGRKRGPTGWTETIRVIAAQLDYSGDRYGVQVERMSVGDNFNPEVGFVRRDNMRRSFGPVPLQSASGVDRPSIRKFSWQGTVDYIENGAGRPGDARHRRRVRDRIPEQRSLQRRRHGQLRAAGRGRFTIAPGVTIPVGELRFRHRPRRLHLRPAAALFGKRVGRARDVLRRRPDGASGFSRGADQRDVSASRSSRASRSTGSICRPGRSRRKLVGSRDHLHDDPADVRERAACNTTRAPTW